MAKLTSCLTALLLLGLCSALYYQKPFYQMRYRPYLTDDSLRLLQLKIPSKKVAAIIVTLYLGTSYDPLFRQVQQRTNQGTQVLVYAGSSNSIQDIYHGFLRKPTTLVVEDLMKNVREVDPDCVVFNWECSSGYSSMTFPQNRSTVMAFLKLILDSGHMAMFSDFSLKSLIAQWDQRLLGSNPFIKIGQTSSSIRLQFRPEALKTSPSAQLQMVGNLAQDGHCNIKTLSSTIVYNVDRNKIDPNRYKLEILTTANTHRHKRWIYGIENDRVTGAAGHVLLTYPTGGKILTSMGHWIELMKVDTSQKSFFQVAQRQYGKGYARKLQQAYSKIDQSAKKSYLQSQARQFIQNQAPSLNMNKKRN